MTISSRGSLGMERGRRKVRGMRRPGHVALMRNSLCCGGNVVLQRRRGEIWGDLIGRCYVDPGGSTFSDVLSTPLLYAVSKKFEVPASYVHLPQFFLQILAIEAIH